MPLRQDHQYEKELERKNKVSVKSRVICTYLKISVKMSSPPRGTVLRKKIPFQGLYLCLVRWLSIIFILMCVRTKEKCKQYKDR